jgi:hypothetical protein
MGHCFCEYALPLQINFRYDIHFRSIKLVPISPDYISLHHQILRGVLIKNQCRDVSLNVCNDVSVKICRDFGDPCGPFRKTLRVFFTFFCRGPCGPP